MIRFRQDDKLAHRFAVGQCVQMKTFGSSQPTGQKFTINALMPVRDGTPQYRLRGESEKHDRVDREDNLVMAVEPNGVVEQDKEGMDAMAKGQVRSNKEIRKPKKDKAAKAAAAPAFGAQVKATGAATFGKPKGK
jgi:hypothetical protein